ncbi:hypothetical protein J437_LFUL007323, partial [Ladona fulva]
DSSRRCSCEFKNCSKHTANFSCNSTVRISIYIMEGKQTKTQMSEAERLELCKNLDKELDDYIDSLEKRSYTEGWPEDRWEEEMEKHPFFMTKTPTDGEQISPLMQGLQNLKYDAEENTPEELASNYKEDGNFNFKYKNYRLAILSYTEGLKAKCGNAVLNAQLLNNRSASQFMLGNYRSSLKDAEACLRLDPSHSKARARAIQCCTKMRNYDNCLKHCDSYLAYDPIDTKMQQIRTETISLKKRADRDSRLEARKMKAKTAASEALMKALRDRGVTLFQEEDEEPQLESLHPAAEGAKVTFGEDGRLSWPCVILYPEYGISDFVQQWHEDITFYSQMSEIFSESPEWDAERKYVPDSLSIFFEGDEDSRRIHRIDPTSTLGEVLSDKRYVIVAGTPKFIVFAKGSKSEQNFIMKYVLS